MGLVNSTVNKSGRVWIIESSVVSDVTSLPIRDVPSDCAQTRDVDSTRFAVMLDNKDSMERKLPISYASDRANFG